MNASASYSLITFNTWKCDGDYLRRIALMRRELEALAPDVLLLQECFVEAEGQTGTAAELGLALGMDVRFEPARYRERCYSEVCGPSWSGMAVLSGLPIQRSARAPLPTHPQDGERIAQITQLAVGDDRVLVVNLHLTYLPAEDEVRCAQLANVLRHPWLAEDYAGIFLAGDFNDGPDGVLMDWLMRRPDWRITDCYLAASGAPGPRHSTLKSQLAVAGAPLGPNFDYVLLVHRPDREPRVKILSADYVLNRPSPESGLYPSDHFGVRVRFRVGP